MDRIYLIKSPAPWMIDELLVFSQHVPFKIMFLREPGAFYKNKIEQLKSNGIEIIVRPFAYRLQLGKLLFCFAFILRNINNLFSGYSFVMGVKSAWWFLVMDDSYFEKPASIHAQFATQASLIALLLSKYHPKNKIHYYFTFHAYDIFFNNKWFVTLVNHSQKCFTISEYNISYVLNKYTGLDRSKLELSRLGVFSNPDGQGSKKGSGYFQVGFISWFVEKKGIQYLLEAMKVLASGPNKIKLMLAGDGPLREEIERFIAVNNLTGCICYAGKLDFDEKARFFSSLDVFVLPSVSLRNDKDGIPVVLMEAISYGLPVISTGISGIPEICIHDFNGILVPEKNVPALINAISSLYEDEARISRYSVNALQVFNNYKIERNSYQKLKTLNWV